MIKVAQVRWGERTGGPERVLRDLAVHLDRDQFDMRFFFLARGGAYEGEMRAMGYPVSVIAARHGYDPGMRLNLAHQLRTFQPNIVHEHGVPPLVRPVAKWATGAHLLSFEHGEIEINKRKGKPWLNWLKGMEYVLFSECVIVNSAANKRSVMAAHRLPPDKVQVVHLGIDLGRFQMSRAVGSRAGSPELVLGYVGRLQDYDKGTDLLPQLVQGLVVCGVDSFKLVVVGDGPDRAALQKTAEAFGVAGRMDFLGRREDVPELMVGMDIVVVPSRLEAFGLVALEALAAGARVVAFDVGGLSEVLADCPEARLVSPGDVPAMAEAVLALWNQYGKQRSLAGRHFVMERFDARRMAFDMMELYRKFA